MANTSKYLEEQSGGDPDFFIMPNGEDTSSLVSTGISNIADFVGINASLISSNSQLPEKNGVYVITQNCTLTMPLGFDGVRITISVTATPTSVPILPTSPNTFNGGNPTLTTNEIREYCFIGTSWYRIR